MSYKKTERESGQLLSLLWVSAKGLLFGIVTIILLALIISAVLVGMTDPMSVVGYFAFAILFIGAFVSTLISALSYREHTVSAALISGTMYGLVIFILSLFLKNENSVSASADMLVGYGGCAVIALLSGLITKNRERREQIGRKSPAALMRERAGKRH